MYATSKLIIPAKISRDYPYVPKIRICLRPSPSLDNNCDMGSSLESDDLLCDTSQSVENSNEFDTTEHNDIQRLETMELFSPSPALQKTSNTGILQNDQTRGNRRRKSVAAHDSIDLEGKDSVLTKISLRNVINKETFEALPLESRRKLLNLLPIYDRSMPQVAFLRDTKDANNNASSASSYTSSSSFSNQSSCWIHPTALNNEFLSKALRDYSAQQANKKSSFRSGLRKTVGNRLRYSNTIKDDILDQNIKSDQAWESPSSLVKSNQTSLKRSSTTSSSPPLPPPPSHKNFSSTTSKKPSSGFQLEGRDSAEVTHNGAKTGARLSRKRKTTGPASKPPRLLLQTNSFEGEDGEAGSDDTPKTSPPSTSSSSSISPFNAIINEGPKLSRLESTLQNGGKPCSNDDFWRDSKKTNRNSNSSNNEFASKLVVDSIAAHRTSSPEMPPPRQTKTLHSMREKLRAKRQLRASQQRGNGTSTTLPQLPPLGFLTPNPHSGNIYNSPPHVVKPLSSASPPDIDALLNAQLPKPGVYDSVSNFIPAGFLSSRPHEPLTIHTPPSSQLPNNILQYSVSAPATPHHDRPSFEQPSPLLIRSSMTSARESPAAMTNYSQLPELLANFKQARVVLLQDEGSLSSSVSSETDTLSLPHEDAVEAAHALSSKTPLQRSDSKRSASQKAVSPENKVSPCKIQPQTNVAADVPPSVTLNVNPPVSTASTSNNNNSNPNNGAAATTRAFIVDGSSLSKTLALLQRINPQATVIQQQFLLIRSTDKSHAFLCRTPVAPNQASTSTTSVQPAIQPKPAEPSETMMNVEVKPEPCITGAASFPSFTSVTKDSAGNTGEVRRSSKPTSLPLILPATRPSLRPLVSDVLRPIQSAPVPILPTSAPAISEVPQPQISLTQCVYRDILPSHVDSKPSVSRESLISWSRMSQPQHLISVVDSRRLCETMGKQQAQPIAAASNTSAFILSPGSLINRGVLLPANSSQHSVHQSMPMSTAQVAFTPIPLAPSVVSLPQPILSSQTPQQCQFPSKPNQQGQHQPGNMS